MCNKEKFWPALCEVIGKAEWADDPQFKTFPDRLRNRSRLTEMLDGVFSTQTTDEWLKRLAGVVPVAPVYDIREALESAFVAEREDVVEYQYPDGRSARMIANPIRVSDAKLPRRSAPGLGEDTDMLLGELGYAADRIARLKRDKVVA
jgi:succinate---hydroxymethylglutarate CoA-transferase